MYDKLKTGRRYRKLLLEQGFLSTKNTKYVFKNDSTYAYKIEKYTVNML